jgi:hypothetical protein
MVPVVGRQARPHLVLTGAKRQDAALEMLLESVTDSIPLDGSDHVGIRSGLDTVNTSIDSVDGQVQIVSQQALLWKRLNCFDRRGLVAIAADDQLGR